MIRAEVIQIHVLGQWSNLNFLIWIIWRSCKYKKEKEEKSTAPGSYLVDDAEHNNSKLNIDMAHADRVQPLHGGRNETRT